MWFFSGRVELTQKLFVLCWKKRKEKALSLMRFCRLCCCYGSNKALGEQNRWFVSFSFFKKKGRRLFEIAGVKELQQNWLSRTTSLDALWCASMIMITSHWSCIVKGRLNSYWLNWQVYCRQRDSTTFEKMLAFHFIHDFFYFFISVLHVRVRSRQREQLRIPQVLNVKTSVTP